MKKIYYLHATFITLLICTLFSCVDDNFFSTTTQQKFNEFSLEEAKTYFKKKAERQLSRSTDIDKNIPLYPGDFTPMWDAAVLSTKNGLACYDIPINETNSYQALFSEEHHGTMNVGKVKVYQKLVILKDVKGDRMSQYILSLIPAKSYASQKGEQIPNLFITRGDKGAFSGIAVYSCLYTGITARVDTYEKGKMLKGVFLLDSKDEKELSKRIEIAQEQLNMLSLHKKRKLLSRGENGNGDDYEYNGGWLDEVIITPDEPWDGVGADGMTNEEWMESTRPDGNVDPQPEPEPEMPEEDYPNPEEEPTKDNEPEISGFDPDEEVKIKEAINILREKLPNIDLDDIKIKKGEGKSNAYIDPSNRDVVITNLYFKDVYIDMDRASILYHEIYHLQNEHYDEKQTKELPDVQTLDLEKMPSSIYEHVINDLHNIVDDISEKSEIPVTEEFRNELFNTLYYDEKVITEIKESEYYENEIKTYQEEKSIFTEVSETYEHDRAYAEWKNNELLEMSNQFFTNN